MTGERAGKGGSVLEEKTHIHILTVSDRCAAGEREDLSGPALEAWLRENGFSEISRGLVPDEKERIMEALCRAAEEDIALVLTTGGTGFAPRDVTPEATASVCEKLCPGVGEAMRARALQITLRGMLSRGTAGIRGRTLIVNLPGSPRAALENLEPVFGPLLHGLKMLRQGPADCAALLPRQL
ncbi:MAG: MogA/MoaB family molybdenum cofactor biosynthesis protein [Oscillospiraceae bacterium]|nr:MogA/MoaB family molybdenum cofactor biosynthesis protein [Oscillospiraceae bacterium]